MSIINVLSKLFGISYLGQQSLGSNPGSLSIYIYDNLILTTMGRGDLNLERLHWKHHEVCVEVHARTYSVCLEPILQCVLTEDGGAI